MESEGFLRHLPHVWILEDPHDPLDAVHRDALLETVETCKSKERNVVRRFEKRTKKMALHHAAALNSEDPLIFQETSTYGLTLLFYVKLMTMFRGAGKPCSHPQPSA